MIIRSWFRRAIVFFAVLQLAACSGSTGQQPEASTDELFFDYKITGEEGNDSITVLLQFKLFTEYGPSLLLPQGASVILDGHQIFADSTPMSGPYYARTIALKDFSGKHQVLLTAADKRKFKEEFSFRSFLLKTELPDTLARDKMELLLEGLAGKDVVRIVITDTSFTGEGINRVDTVLGNRLVISRADLSVLQSGPVNMELIGETERPVANGTEAGGTLVMYYTVRREFWLRD